jgi:flagellar biosynthetic protein FliQ
MALFVGRRAMEIAFLLASPVLVVTLLVGVVTAMLQAVTSIRDNTIAQVLKLFAAGATMLLCGGWLVHVATNFTGEIFQYIQSMGH